MIAVRGDIWVCPRWCTTWKILSQHIASWYDWSSSKALWCRGLIRVWKSKPKERVAWHPRLDPKIILVSLLNAFHTALLPKEWLISTDAIVETGRGETTKFHQINLGSYEVFITSHVMRHLENLVWYNSRSASLAREIALLIKALSGSLQNVRKSTVIWISSVEFTQDPELCEALLSNRKTCKLCVVSLAAYVQIHLDRRTFYARASEFS